MALTGSGDEWRTPDTDAVPVRPQETDTDPPDTLGHGETIDNLIGGGNWRTGPPAAVHSTTNTTSEQHTGHEMWTVGGGKDGYDQLGDARIADDPVLSIFLRNDEVESHNCGAGVRDRDGTRIKCDKSESEVLQSKGARATWHARHIAVQLHARHHFTHTAATDGSRMEKDGNKRVAFGVFEGVPPTPPADPTDPEEWQAQQTRRHSGEQIEPRDTIQERAGKGIWGRRLPDSWEIMDAELYAIYAYLRNCADTATENNTACRCLVLSDCKSALIAIERAYRRQAQRSGDNRNLISAILLQLHRLQQHKGYAIFLWTPGHAGVAPNAMADAAAKAYLNKPHNPNTAAAFS